MTYPFKTPLRLYRGSTGRGGYDERKVPLDPVLCPVSSETNEGRAGLYVEQCQRRPKPGEVYPVHDWWDNGPVEEREVCGIHGGVYRRMLKKYETEEHDKQVRVDMKNQMEEIAKRIQGSLASGPVTVHEVPIKFGAFEHRVSGKVLIDGAELLRFAERYDRLEDIAANVLVTFDPTLTAQNATFEMGQELFEQIKEAMSQ